MSTESPLPAQDAEAWFYTDANNQPVGPHALSELAAMLKKGQLSAHTQVIKQGESEWKNLATHVLPPPPPVTSSSVQTGSPMRMPTILAVMCPQRRYAGFAALVGMLGTFMPWLKVPILGSISGTEIGDGNGWMTFFLLLSTVLLCLSGQRSEPLRQWRRWTAMGCAVLAGLIAFLTAVMISDHKQAMLRDAGDNPFAQLVSAGFQAHVQTGFGIYLIVGAAAWSALAMLYCVRGQGDHDLQWLHAKWSIVSSEDYWLKLRERFRGSGK